jgi:GDP-4-dehydro-6-deoxy-D-mannose reductase
MIGPVAPRRILLTGAGGFVGGWVLRQLDTVHTPELEVFASGHQSETHSAAAKTVRLDITDRAEVDAVIGALRPDAVLHLAAVSNVNEAREAPRQAWDANLYGTMNLAQAVLKHCPAARFIFVSTSEVYGGAPNPRGATLDETAPLDPLNPYAASKAAADLMVGQMAREGLNAIRVRPFNHTGPGQTERFVIPAFAAQIARIEGGAQEPVIRVGNLDARRDFLDVRDVADAYLGLALSSFSFQPGLILNLASGTARRIGEILDELISLASVKIRVDTDPSRLRLNETPFATADAGRIHGLLGWEPHIAWSKTLADVLEFWRAAARRPPGPQTVSGHDGASHRGD